jgi:hypothetical protein
LFYRRENANAKKRSFVGSFFNKDRVTNTLKREGGSIG